MTIKELEEKIDKSSTINESIARGKDIITTIYWGGGICPKVKILTINPNRFALVKVLENTKADSYEQILNEGEITGYWFSSSEFEEIYIKI